MNRQPTNFNSFILSALLLLLLLQLPIQAQWFSNSIRRYTALDGNKIRTLYYNYGSLGYPAAEPSFEWPNGSGQGYAYEFGLLVGASVLTSENERKHIVNDGLLSAGVLADCGEIYNPGMNSGWEPVPGYAQPDSGGSIARSDDPDSWPDSWTSWPGVHADGEVLADLETYYVMDDRYNCSFMDQYQPDPTNPDIGGAGIQVGVRSFQWAEEGQNDYVLLQYEVTNTSAYTIDSLILGVKGDPHIGGSYDYNDDNVGIITALGIDVITGEDRPEVKNLIYSWDNNFSSDPSFFGRDPGYLGIHIPNESLNVQSFHVEQYSRRLQLGDYFWNRLTDENWDSGNFYNNADNIVLMGLESVMLEPGESITVPMVYIFGETKAELIANVERCESRYQSIFMPEIEPPSIQINSPQEDDIVTPNMEIEWSLNQGTETIDSVCIYLNDYRVTGWQKIATLDPTVTSYVHNINELPSGINYQLAIRAFCGGAGYATKSDHFKILRLTESQPEFLLLNPTHDIELSGVLDLEYRASIGADSSASLSLLISTDGGDSWLSHISDLPTGSQSVALNTRQIPNGDYVRFAFVRSLEDASTFMYESNQHKINNSFPAISDENFEHFTGISDSEVSIDIVDYSEITGDEYEITFTDSMLLDVRYTVSNMNTGEVLINNEVVPQNHFQGAAFEGLRLTFVDVDHVVIDSLSGWRNSPTNLIPQFGHNNASTGAFPFDYEMIFYDSSIDTSVINGIPLTFVTTNITTGANVAMHAFGLDDSGFVEGGSRIYVLQQAPGTDEVLWIPDWSIRFDEPDSSEAIPPFAGDTLRLVCQKPFSHRDTLRFSTHEYLDTEPAELLPSGFTLRQNYPNPFNPKTQISYQLLDQAEVTLNIYDLRGRLINTLATGQQNSGNYTVQWSGVDQVGNQVSSGIYFCTLSTGNGASVTMDRQTIKMIYLK